MSGLWNPFAFGVTGNPVLAETPPALRVYGAEPTKEQLAMAQHAFARFCSTSRLSAVPNPVERGRLPDGSEYRIVVVGKTPIMEVVLVEDEEAENVSGVYVSVVESGKPPSPVTCFPSGRFGAPGANWKIKRGSRFHALPVDSFGVGYRPKFACESWASRTASEYYVQRDFYVAERNGKLNLSWTFSGVDLPLDPLSPSSPMARMTVGGERSFGALFVHEKRVFLGYGDAFNTDSMKGAVNVPLKAFIPVIGLVTDPQKTIVVATSSPDATRSMVVEQEVVPLDPAPGPGETVRTVARFAFRGFGSTEPTNTLFVVDAYQFNGSTWDAAGNVLARSEPTCDPLLLYTEGSPPFYSPVVGGGIRVRATGVPTFSTNSLLGTPSTAWSFPDPMVVLPAEMLSHDFGLHAYSEVSTYSATDQLWTEGEGACGAWFTHDNTPRVATHDLAFSWSLLSSGGTNNTVVGDLYSRYLGGGEYVWTASDYVIGDNTETSNFTRERVEKDTYRNGLLEIVLKDLLIKETGLASRREEILHYTPVEDGGGPDHSVLSITATVDVKFEERRILVVDPQFDLSCYIEAEFDFTRTASASRTTDYSPYEDLGSGTGQPHITYSGGDTEPAPEPPIAYIVIDLAGVEVFRQPVVSNRSPADISALPIRFDTSIYWSLPGFILNPGQIFGSNLRSSVLNDMWSAGEWVDQSTPLFSGPTLMASIKPLGASGSDYITADYAKDPRTGAAVLSIGGTNGLTATRYQYAFTVDSGGLSPLSSLIPEAAASYQINEVAAT